MYLAQVYSSRAALLTPPPLFIDPDLWEASGPVEALGFNQPSLGLV